MLSFLQGTSYAVAALYLLMAPSGVRLRQKTQVPGKIRDIASAVGTSFQVPFFSNNLISASAALFQFWMFSTSDMASSKLKVSGSLTLACLFACDMALLSSMASVSSQSKMMSSIVSK